MSKKLAIAAFLPGEKRKQKPKVKHVFSGKVFEINMTLTEAIKRYPYVRNKTKSSGNS